MLVEAEKRSVLSLDRGCEKVLEINSVWVEAVTRSGKSISIGRGCEKVWKINSVRVEAATRSGKSTQCG